MSTFVKKERASGEGKGLSAEVSIAAPGRGCWAAGEYPSDCHILWSAIIDVVWPCLSP